MEALYNIMDISKFPILASVSDIGINIEITIRNAIEREKS